MDQRNTKTIVCLANSRKPPHGRCVAGREIGAAGFGGWVRAVSARPTREVSLHERRYADGQDPRVLDVIAIDMVRHEPHQHQPENHVIDARRCWSKQGSMTWEQLQPAVEDPGGPLWLNGCSSQHGLNDRMPEDRLADVSRSLYLIRPEPLRLVVAEETNDAGQARRRVRAHFNFGEHPYCLAVTDPWVEFHFLVKGEGETCFDEALLCISLGEPYHGHAYKLAATLITPRPLGPRHMPGCVYTIGHSTHATERFIELLSVHGVNAVADVRSHPYSRFNPQFNRETLQADLKKAGLAYVFLGRELGARPEDQACYVDGSVRYDLLAGTKLFQQGLRRLVDGSRRYRIALMCAEKDPLTCHRAILVCRQLAALGIAAQHILEDGRIETHDEALERLLKELDSPINDLFRSRAEVIADAYDARADQIAYTAKQAAGQEIG